MVYNPTILANVLRARSLTQAELSRRLEIDASTLRSELDRQPEPAQGILNRIANELAVPVFTFFRETAPELDDTLPDFRSDKPQPKAKTKETLRAIQFGEGVQKALKGHTARSAPSEMPRLTASDSAGVTRIAHSARQYFDITLEDQIEAKDDRAFYLICRQKIEARGVLVLHHSFPEQDGSGFCLYDARHPVIVVNTKAQTWGRRLFTLAHELAHVLHRSSGISDPFICRNSIERTCNRFAGSFLVPEAFAGTLLRLKNDAQITPDEEHVRWASRRLKISQEATVLRLEQLGIYTTGSYEKWKRLVHNRNPDYLKRRGGPGKDPVPQEKVKLSKYGFQFARAFDEMLEQGLVSEINLYRATGLKPQYQRPYFDYVKSLTPEQLRSLELDDE
ncbi:helix-turn-helix domain-containing protein [Bradyrhizobium sp. 6(2017)]|uniref:helix-turn-helix domain-containing protein n=1 Tax=Bradyrhizobium sp. 6(2017) TaxID=1197460 RepID=UPI0013E18E18|nr:ImmA/IrrE family metallo-endopeptidase [Bradyrhizobium sp. 6(2017)]QIG96575.1 ImmA/IrrE family metallo-endopeptidase [Bradyrhizobium sp. 6(2017)]